MIDVKLKKKLGSFDIDVEFSSDSMGITVLAGPSGSGKTTIINMISGLLTPDEGRIFVKDRFLFDSGKKINCPVQQRRCGYVFQDGRLFPHMNVRSNLLYGKHSDHSMLDETVSLLGIEHLLHRMPGKLSGGEKQRVAIGRALLMRPQVLLMDEPLASLDQERREELLSHIDRLPEQFGIPIFYVTHSIREILRLSDRLIRIEKGRVKSSGKPEGEYKGLGLYEANGDYVSVLDCIIKSFDREFGVITAKFSGGMIRILAEEPPCEQNLRIAIKAVDVAVSLVRPENISTTNIFKGVISEMEETKGHSLLLHCDIGSPLVAQVSKASAVRLGFERGKEVFLLIKVVSMIY
ncbi:MAG TPA: molybdenum ABC transporter ATP-binding protein [Spirochaetota bacterium]|nr:molybdenum ABC transporter ATP-binding protein [Spirochaetota bacterium]HPJ35107.1 molybdenum ABC transporter ATP-binding protein [Spirochaetota bacterium]